MKKKSHSILIAVIALFVAGLAAPLSAQDGAQVSKAGNVVTVLMKDQTVVQLQADSFVMPWVALEIQDEVTCDKQNFDMADVTEVLVLSESVNSCDGYLDGQLFDVYFGNHTPLRGFIEVQEPRVRGKLKGGGEEMTYPLADVLKITFSQSEL